MTDQNRYSWYAVHALERVDLATIRPNAGVLHP